MCQRKCCLSHHAQLWESDCLPQHDCRYTDCLILVHLRTVQQSPALSVQPSSVIGLQLPSILSRKTMGLDASGSQKVWEGLGKTVAHRYPIQVEHLSSWQTFYEVSSYRCCSSCSLANFRASRAWIFWCFTKTVRWVNFFPQVGH